MNFLINEDYILFSFSFFQITEKNSVFFFIFSVFIFFFSYIFSAVFFFSDINFSDNIIIVTVINCVTAALFIIVSDEVITALHNTKVMRSETALFYYCV